ncbi:MAG TPA: glycosyltransferase [Tepidisphaeraceae bacterium]|jgi:GT2 family glycosyltransferase|nr:glycosyltransferase [Tepidisphaeraceae bacterium]
MISIIICSPNDARFAAVSKNLAALLKDESHEIIRIGDARSMCEGYTRGIAQSHGDRLIFCHDDIEILNTDFAARLREHLDQFDLVGVAGTSRLIRGEWVAAGPPYIFGQVAQIHPRQGFVVRIFGIPGRSAGGIQAMDGLLFAARRSVVEKIRFDAQTFDGFHHYDLDFSFAAHLAGFRLGIANDIHILHGSWGTQDESWRQSARRFHEKYADKLFRMTPRPFTFASIHVRTKHEVLEVMTGNP